ncbi:MAG: hypothetical protein CM15mV33_700 [uncultured marine virus]|nr:MAG: hypothetical protein CM15mV33_700 [uncultured marine virus]
MSWKGLGMPVYSEINKRRDCIACLNAPPFVREDSLSLWKRPRELVHLESKQAKVEAKALDDGEGMGSSSCFSNKHRR